MSKETTDLKNYLDALELDEKNVQEIMDKLRASDTTDLEKQLKSVQAELDSKLKEIEVLQEEKQNSEKVINSLKNKTKDDEQAQKLINDYKNQIEQIQAQALKDRIHSKVILELVDQGCSDPELLSYLIKEDNVQVNKDGTFTGIAEQIQLLKADEKRSAYFKSNEAQETIQPERGGYPPELSNPNGFNTFGDYSSAFNTMTKTAEPTSDPILNILKERDEKMYSESGDPQKFWDALG